MNVNLGQVVGVWIEDSIPPNENVIWIKTVNQNTGEKSGFVWNGLAWVNVKGADGIDAIVPVYKRSVTFAEINAAFEQPQPKITIIHNLNSKDLICSFFYKDYINEYQFGVFEIVDANTVEFRFRDIDSNGANNDLRFVITGY